MRQKTGHFYFALTVQQRKLTSTKPESLPQVPSGKKIPASGVKVKTFAHRAQRNTPNILEAISKPLFGHPNPLILKVLKRVSKPALVLSTHEVWETVCMTGKSARRCKSQWVEKAASGGLRPQTGAWAADSSAEGSSGVPKFQYRSSSK